MDKLVTGIHHVTALAGNAQKNLDFYTGILGLRLIKKTVNFDANQIYHLYYGDAEGNPGSVLTFFPYDGLKMGRHGKGMLNTTTFSVPLDAIEFWENRLKQFGVNYKEPQLRFETEVVIYFEDHDGLGMELIFNDYDKRTGYHKGPFNESNAIRGFHNVEIWHEGYEQTGGLLTEYLDHELIAESNNRFRFAADNSSGNYIDILCEPNSLRGLAGSGTVHHLAFKTADRTSQEKIREKIVERGLNPTEILDRNYFTSIYFKEPGGVLFEVATAGPGFAVDEDIDHLGEELKLPGWFEKERETIEKALPKLILTDPK